jgi:hypothetical protein
LVYDYIFKIHYTYCSDSCSLGFGIIHICFILQGSLETSEEEPSGPAPCKIKTNVEMLPVDQSTDNGHGPVLVQASREYGKEGLAGTSCPWW